MICGMAGETYAFIRRDRKQNYAIDEMEKKVLEAADDE